MSNTTNPINYGDLPLSVVQRIATYIYQTRTYLDPVDNMIIIHREGKMTFPWKPLTNPRHIVDVIHRLLEETGVSLSRCSEGDYCFDTIDGDFYIGETIWEAAVLLVLSKEAK